MSFKSKVVSPVTMAAAYSVSWVELVRLGEIHALMAMPAKPPVSMCVVINMSDCAATFVQSADCQAEQAWVKAVFHQCRHRRRLHLRHLHQKAGQQLV